MRKILIILGLIWIPLLVMGQTNNTTPGWNNGDDGDTIKSILEEDIAKGNTQHDSLVIIGARSYRDSVLLADSLAIIGQRSYRDSVELSLIDLSDAVTKVGTPVNNELGVWTGNGTLEGEGNLIFSSGFLGVTGGITATSTIAADPGMAAGRATLGANGIVFEGAAGDAFEGLLSGPVTSSDKTWTLPDATGLVTITSGTPVDNQVGVWTADGIMEGDADLTFDGDTLGLDLIAESTPGAGVTTEGVLLEDGSVKYPTGVTPSVEPAGLTWWNTSELTLNIASGLGPVLQVGQEDWTQAYNNTGSQINDGQVVRIDSANGVNPTIELAKADSPLTVDQILGFATMDIPDGTIGIVTTGGKVRGIDTNAEDPGDEIYVSAITAGDFTATQPAYPNYIMTVGSVFVSAVDTGVIYVNPIGRIEDILENGWNGGFLETINFEVVSNGTVITGTLENGDDNTRDLTMNFSDGFTMMDVTPDDSVTLTVGTDTNPQTNYVYVLQSNKTLTASTSDWPVTEHIKVATVVVKSASSVQSEGAMRNQNWNDHIASTNSQGHILHIAERIRQSPAKWWSGAEGSATVVTAPTPDSITFAATSGIIYQLHRQTFSGFDMATGADLHIINDNTSPYKTVTNFGNETTDAEGNSLTNSSFSVVLWGAVNKTGTPSHLMLNLPTGSYGRLAPDDAVQDPTNYSVYDIPALFDGVGFLIARFTFQLTADGNTWTLYDTENLRGKIPNTTAGGGAGGGGVSTFLGLIDIPSSYASQALNLVQVNAGETAMEFTGTPTVDGITVNGNIAVTGTVDGIDIANRSHTTLADIGTLTHAQLETMFQDTLGWFIVDAQTYGDSATDATAHIQSKINAASRYGGAGYVYIPPGKYVLLDSLTVPSHITLIGAGYDFVTVLMPRRNKSAIFVNQSKGTMGKLFPLGSRFYNFAIWGQGTADSTLQNGIVINHIGQMEIDKVYFRQLGGHGVLIGVDSVSGGVLIENSAFVLNRKSAAYGRKKSTTNTTVNGITFRKCYFYLNFSHAIDVVAHKVLVDNCTIEFNDSVGFYVNPLDVPGEDCYAVANTIINSRFEDNGGGEMFFWQEWTADPFNHLNYGTKIEGNYIVNTISYDKPEATAMITVQQGPNGTAGNSRLRNFKAGHNTFVRSTSTPYFDLGGDGSGGVREDVKIWVPDDADISADVLNTDNAILEFDGVDIAPLAATFIDATGITENDIHPKVYLSFSGNLDITANPQFADAEVDGYPMQVFNGDATDTLTLDNGNGLSLNSTSLTLAPNEVIDFTFSETEDLWMQSSQSNSRWENITATGTSTLGVVTASTPIADASIADDITITNISQVSDITSTAAEVNYTDGVTSAIQTQLDAKQDKVYAFNAQIGTTYTFVLDDNDEFVTLSNASPITATVPPNSSVAYDVGTTIDCSQIGAGAVTFAEGAGVTINSFGSDLVSAGQYSVFTLLKTATNTWLLFGGL